MQLGAIIWVKDVEVNTLNVKVHSSQTKTIASTFAEMFDILMILDFDLTTTPLIFTMYEARRNENPFQRMLS